MAELSQQRNNPSTTDDIDTALIADVKVVKDLQDLEGNMSSMMIDTRKDLKDCDIAEVQFYLDDLLEVDEFRECQNIDEVLRKLRRDHTDTFNINYLRCLVTQFHQNEAIVKKMENTKKRKRSFSETRQSISSNKLL